MGLSAPKRRNRISDDPNNLAWSRCTTRYGHRMLEAQGWTPGSHLDVTNASQSLPSDAANAGRLRLVLDDGNAGLGAGRGRERAETYGLGGLQGLLGRLNGKSDAEVKKEKESRRDVQLRLHTGRKYGFLNFVSGGLLVGDAIKRVDKKGTSEEPASTWLDTIEDPSKPASAPKKRKRDKSEEMNGTSTYRSAKKTKKEKAKADRTDGEFDDSREDHAEFHHTATAESASKKAKTKAEWRASREAKRVRKEQRHQRRSEKEQRREERRQRKRKKQQKETEAVEMRQSLQPDLVLQDENVVPNTSRVLGRQALRQRYIQQKKLASSDMQALKEASDVLGRDWVAELIDKASASAAYIFPIRPPASILLTLDSLECTTSGCSNTLSHASAREGIQDGGISNNERPEPPNKRQKLNNHQPSDLNHVQEVLASTSDHITLLKVTLPLLLLGSTDGLDTFLAKPLHVSLQSAEAFGDDGVSLTVRLHGTPTVSLRIVAATDNPFQTVSKLLDVVELGKRGQQKSDRDQVWSQCLLLPPNWKGNQFHIQGAIFYPVGVARAGAAGSRVSSDIGLLAKYLNLAGADQNAKWTPHDFYQNLHVPHTDVKVPPEISKAAIASKLYPFQERAVEWMLRREGKAFNSNPSSENAQDNPLDDPSFVKTKDADGQTSYVSLFQGLVVKDAQSVPQPASRLRGGILAEEMGLGKTVELIALMILHERKMFEAGKIHDQYTGTYVIPSPSTLIITPPAILQQWKTELNIHAPHLKVMHYEGLPAVSKSFGSGDDDLVQEMLDHDVVITTYHVLSQEIHYADSGPDRSLRHKKKYERRRSPLVQISWWRVCLDEAQMVESGVSAAAIVAHQIPRINAWAVSGTPLRKDIQDLLGLLIFLRYEPYCYSKRLWTRLVKGPSKALRDVFQPIALRHTKDRIREDLRLPPQKRMVITIPFSAIEEQNYGHLFQQMCDDVGLSPDGSPLSGLWDPDSPTVIEKMRNWLVRLRQTCLHPQVGGRNRRALGRGEGPLRTVGEVLEMMIEQNESSFRGEERLFLLAKVMRGHVIGNNKSNERRSIEALAIYQEALEQAKILAEESRQQLAQERKRHADSSSKPALDSTTDSEGIETDTDEKKVDKTSRLTFYRQNLRSALGMQHVCAFFTATAFYQIKSNEQLTKPESEKFHAIEKQETEMYDQAKKIRKELLRDAHNKAEKLMRILHRNRRRNSFTKVSKLSMGEDIGGIENRKVLQKLDLLAEALNDQASQLIEWRSKIVDILLQPLVDEEDGLDTTGEEYEDSTKQQDELYVYVDSLRAVVADRFCALSGQSNLLIDHEMKQLVRQAKNQLELPPDAPAEMYTAHAPELLLQNMQIRDQIKPSAEMGSLRGTLHEVRSMATALEWQEGQGSSRATAELGILRTHLAKLQDILAAQLRSITGLEAELTTFRSTMNQRLEFYRQLQHESDMVKPYKEELDDGLDQQALTNATEREKELAEKVANLKTKRRFLIHLRTEQEQQEEQRICVICQSTFEQGVLTVCGHLYCKDCIRLWWNQHRTCPTCKRYLSLRDFHQITYKPKEIKAKEESSSSALQNHSPSQGTTTLYSEISTSTMNEIKSIDLDGSFGTKIDTLARHILWIRENDPGSKSIVFSQYRDFLTVLSRAFAQFKIGCTSISHRGGIDHFRSDPSTEVFLLDAKSDSSGLNLVNATHVFLCEPLINAAIELQAIARVHRIGQQRPTTVYMYLISDTVEEAIYDISVTRRLAHISSSSSASTSSSSSSKTGAAPALQQRSRAATPSGQLQERAIDAANSLEMERAPISKMLVQGKGSGEMVEKDDLWSCLFGKPRRRQEGEVSEQLETEVGRHLRVEAAERRAAGEGPAAGIF
ncbi:MAG: hypothetical protein M1821_006425 [Bathelium mastoideum]|nr:MAG: hypothetical protein M1821_006425 [Bathelium mastoideum]